MGAPVEKAVSRDSLANPAALDYFIEMAGKLQAAGKPRARRQMGA